MSLSCLSHVKRTNEKRPDIIPQIYIGGICVDRSGSMIGLEAGKGAIEVTKQAANITEKCENSLWTIITFDDEIKTLEIPKPHNFDKKDEKNILKECSPRGSTALYDAGIQLINKILKEKERIQKIQKKEVRELTKIDMFAAFITDGQDNSSLQSLECFREKIELFKKSGGKCVFVGANIDAQKTGTSLGINKNSCLQFTPVNNCTQNAFNSIGLAMQRSVTNYGEQPSFTQLERYSSIEAPLHQVNSAPSQLNNTNPPLSSIFRATNRLPESYFSVLHYLGKRLFRY